MLKSSVSLLTKIRTNIEDINNMITYYNQLVTYLNKHGQINTCLSSTDGTFFKKKDNHKSGHKVSPNFE